MGVKRRLGFGLPFMRKYRPKRKTGKGLKTRKPRRKTGRGFKKQRKTGKGLPFKQLVNVAKKSLGKQHGSLEFMTGEALDVVHREIAKKRGKFKLPRVIPVPKKIGAGLPLIPLLAGISALGGAASGVSSIVRSIGEIIDAKRRIFPNEKKQVGNGLYLAPYKKNGFGLYLSPYTIKN
jgi:hypothetical protein